MGDDQMAYSTASISAVAVPKTEQMMLVLKADDGDPDFVAALPARAVGPFIAELMSEIVKMPVNLSGDAVMPMKLTGARPAWTADKQPLLLLQLDDAFEIAIQIAPENMDHVRSAIEGFEVGPPASGPRSN